MKKRDIDQELDDFGRFAEPALLILVSLADGPKHGYAMTEDIAAVADVRFGPGTLYGAIARLETRGLIERLEADDRRNPYRLTALGEKALRARLASMWVCRSISPGRPVKRRRSTVSAPAGTPASPVATRTIRSPSMTTTASVMTREPSQSWPNRIAFVCAETGSASATTAAASIRARTSRTSSCSVRRASN